MGIVRKEREDTYHFVCDIVLLEFQRKAVSRSNSLSHRGHFGVQEALVHRPLYGSCHPSEPPFHHSFIPTMRDRGGDLCPLCVAHANGIHARTHTALFALPSSVPGGRINEVQTSQGDSIAIQVCPKKIRRNIHISAALGP